MLSTLSANAAEAAKSIVIYFSHTGENYSVGVIQEGNTAKVAKEIARATGADIWEIREAEPYPANYKSCTERAKKELQAKARPAFQGTAPDLSKYETVFLGYPIWWGEPPMVVYSFLEKAKTDGKEIYPFCTHEGSGLGSTARNLARAFPKAGIEQNGLAIYGHVAQKDAEAVRKAVAEWLKELGLPKTASKGRVPFLKLNNGAEMPQFGIGTFNQGSDETCRKSVLAALRAGYRHIDTAHAYQDERGVGQAIREFCGESGVPRSEIWVTSKLWPTEYGEGVSLDAIDKMLKRLQLDYIDLLYVHQPAGDYLGAWRDMEKAVRQGKVRTLGVSNFDYDDHTLEDMVSAVTIKPAVLQIECHPHAQRLDIRKRAAKLGIQIETWFPLGGSGKGNQSLLNDEVIKDIAKSHGKTAAQVILRWHVQEGFAVIPGSKNPEHIKENIDIFDFELTDGDMERIRALNTESRYYIPRPEDLQRFLQFKPAD